VYIFYEKSVSLFLWLYCLIKLKYTVTTGTTRTIPHNYSDLTPHKYNS